VSINDSNVIHKSENSIFIIFSLEEGFLNLLVILYINSKNILSNIFQASNLLIFGNLYVFYFIVLKG